MYPDADLADTLLVILSATVTPVLRGNRLSSWTAAQAIATLQLRDCLEALHAAPLALPDAAVLMTEDRDLNDDEMARWQTEQDRLAAQRHQGLGVRALPSNPAVLVWHGGYVNEAFTQALSRFACPPRYLPRSSREGVQATGSGMTCCPCRS